MKTHLRKANLVAVFAILIASCRDSGQATATPVTSDDAAADVIKESPVVEPDNAPDDAPDNAIGKTTDDISTNAVSYNGTKTEELAPPPALDFSPPSAKGLQQGWASIEERADPAMRAWLEGTTQRPDVIVIATENISQFKLNLPHLGVDWSKRIALRIDGSTSELTKKRWPSMTLMRTPAGAWVVVD